LATNPNNASTYHLQHILAHLVEVLPLSWRTEMDARNQRESRLRQPQITKQSDSTHIHQIHGTSIRNLRLLSGAIDQHQVAGQEIRFHLFIPGRVKHRRLGEFVTQAMRERVKSGIPFAGK
jgi:hypothetical protein